MQRIANLFVFFATCDSLQEPPFLELQKGGEARGSSDRMKTQNEGNSQNANCHQPLLGVDYPSKSDKLLYVQLRKEKLMQDTLTKKMFYLCDDESENYFIARIYRSDDEIKDELKNLKVGEVHQISKTKHFIRWE